MPKKPYIDYDYQFMLREHVSGVGFTTQKIRQLERDLLDVQQGFRKNPEILRGLLSSATKQDLKHYRDLAAKLRTKAKHLIVIGIGGSDLGARALIKSLSGNNNVHFIGATTDPDALEAELSKLNLTETAINVVSKSGTTLETLATFSIIQDRLAKIIGTKKLRERIVVTTGSSGILFDYAQQEEYTMLHIPEHIGGRFSVFTACGLFPAAFAGLAIEKIIMGANAVFDDAIHASPTRSGPVQFAGMQYLAYADQRLMNTALISYSTPLQTIGEWFRQLWAESLGKSTNRNGGAVDVGLTPLFGIGPSDQHSQLQLYLDGPKSTLVNFLRLENHTHEIKVPALKLKSAAITQIQGRKLSHLLDIECAATAMALAQNGRMSGTLTLQKCDAEHIGALLAFFMSATVALGELLDINVFDQPAVEAIKKNITKMLTAKKK
jgi:glucose-6-phosphate isomerase